MTAESFRQARAVRIEPRAIEPWQGKLTRWRVECGGRQLIVYGRSSLAALHLVNSKMPYADWSVYEDTNEPGILVKDRWS